MSRFGAFAAHFSGHGVCNGDCRRAISARLKFIGGRVAGAVFLRIFLAALSLVFFAGGATAKPLSLIPPDLAAAPSALQVPPAPVSKAALTTTTPVPVPAPVAAPAQAAIPAEPKEQAAKTRYNVVVFGDSLGDGLWAGLYHTLRKDKRFNVIRKSRVATGFVRKDYFDWSEGVREAAAETHIDIAVIIMGTNDRQTIVEDGARHALFTPKWREVYEARVDDFTVTLKASGARIYWVGLPVMRGATFESDMENFSAIFEKRAVANGIIFVPTHDLVADKDGKYSAYGLDTSGRKRLLRAEDGIHFTMEGYDLLAHAVRDTILRDVDSGVVAAGASTGIISSAAAEAQPKSAASIGLKAQIYDVAEGRPGRSDDWRWSEVTR